MYIKNSLKYDYYMISPGLPAHVHPESEWQLNLGSSVCTRNINLFHYGYLQTHTLANSEDPDEIQYNAAFHHSLHCLQR